MPWFVGFTSALAAIFIILFPVSIQAHIGEQNVVFEGTAGPYPLRVIIKAPRSEERRVGKECW